MNRAVYQEKCRHSFAYDSTPLYSRDNEFGDPAGKMGVCLDDRCSSYVALDKGEYQRVGMTINKRFRWGSGTEHNLETEVWSLTENEPREKAA